MRLLVALLMIVLANSGLTAEPVSVGAVELDRSQRFHFRSEAVDDVFQIDVVLPIGYAESKARYPVVYVTDSNYLLTSAAATQLAQATEHLPKMIFVGIGWDVPSIADTAQIRARDFSPTCDQAWMKRRAQPAHLCGGADKFLDFFQNELKPFVNGQYRASGDDVLVGYSFGGLFALHTLFSRAELFDRYVIGSASIEWDDHLLLAQEARYAKKHKDLDKVVFLAVGGLEGEGVIPNTYRMYEQLQSRDYPGLDLHLEVLPDETHMTAINATVMRGLRAVFRDSTPR